MPVAQINRAQSAINTIVNNSVVMAKLVASGQASARELLQSCIAQINAIDSQVDAFIDKTFERALLEADAGGC